MTNDELRNLSLNTLAGASSAQAIDMTRHALTGKGQSWLPNSLARKAGIPNPSLKNWATAGKLPFGLKGNFAGMHPTKGGTAGLVAAAGYGGYALGDMFIDTKIADNIGLGRQDLRSYGADLQTNLNQGMQSLRNLKLR
jgi:hypothetical protein